MAEQQKSIFISHSSKDINLTKELCNYLESAGQKCWYSERDLDKSVNTWSPELVKAIIECKAIIFIGTTAAFSSPQTFRELSEAGSRGKIIIPYMCENVAIPLSFEYFLKSPEQISAYDMTKKDSFDILLKKFTNRTIVCEEDTVSVKNISFFQKEASCFEGIQNGSYGVGYDKCLKKNSNRGWSPSEIFIEEIIEEEFTFSSIGYPEYDERYKEFCSSAEYQKIERRGNNQERWMLTEIYQNQNIFLTLQRTRWSLLTFWWNQVRNNPKMQKEMARYTFSEEGPLFPNSLCLHLILETADGKLIGTKISHNKKNDYGYSIAITLGEQFERTDFSNEYMNNNNFLYTWCRRACMEEIGFSNDEYIQFVSEDSIRVLGIDYEGDIYNFAIPVYLRLKLTFEDFVRYIKQNSKNPDEFTDIVSYTEQEIMEVLSRASEEEMQKKYHPSSFLRMLLYIAYKNPDLLLKEGE